MGSPFRRARMLVVALVGAAVLAAGSIGAAGAPGDKPVPKPTRCTHGLSSIGPVEIVNGKVVGGSLTPHTEACLP